MVFDVEIDPGKPVLIAGPTASGKSALAARLAERHGGVIVNADALQVYACWRILTARPAPADEARLPHRLYGHVPCAHGYSVGAWLEDLKPVLAEPGGRPPIIVGGTGLFFAALTQGLAEIPQIDPEWRGESERLLASRGLPALLADLGAGDPRTASRIDARNPKRVQRAWEVLKGTGRGLSEWQDETPPPLLPLAAVNPILLDAPKEWLNPRIERRFQAMLAEGLLEECRANRPDWTGTGPSAQAIGAKVMMAHLDGAIDLREAGETICTETRQYAKRQRSWFRARMRDWRRIAPAGA